MSTGLPAHAPAVFPVGGRRLVVYVVWDRRGEVEDYIPFALAGLREHAARVLVVVNGSLSAEGRAKLEPVSDEILVRENRGFDIWAHKDALDHVGAGLSEFDEVLLTNDTWFGPVRPYGPVFERMGAESVHFWGMTDHAREEPNPFTGEGVLDYHLQSFWIAVRREMFLSEAWAEYWRDLPVMPGYFDAVLKHEAVFTEHFLSRGFSSGVAYPSADYPTDHPALFNADLLLADGCPVLKRRPFFHYPTFLDRHGVIGREILQKVAAYDYPMPLLWEDLARNVPPKTLNADAAMLEVLPEIDVSYDPERPLRIVAILNITNVDMADEMLDRVDHLPGADLVITTNEERRAEKIRRLLAERPHPADRRTEVRVVPSKLGRHMSAFLIGCRDILLSDDYDLVLKLHSKRSSKKSHNASRYFTRHQFENLSSSPGYVANVLALFQKEPGLGVVFPPMVHIGIPTMGQGWSGYRPLIEDFVEELGIKVPLDDVSPLAPLGGMFFARPEALRVLLRREWTYDDYAPKGKDRLLLGPVQERLIAYAAGESGMHCRTVLNAEHADISHTAIEFKLDQLSSTTPGYPIDQIQFLHRAGWTGRGGAVPLARMYLRLNHPRVSHAIDPVYQAARRAVIRARVLNDRLRGRS
ncbi:rhamnan synthesis F family protein [Microbacterium sp. RU33B]|uniref:rhamnan synthesis F family protein n=1 Tax=Microbacterium sp. RU33B TaxID=1907390 RepID=UPI00095BA74B|nr:rhamnan synthesis F family protein [Microbacterium sp. RU33B]SIT88734.1 rhamnosyltransferase [Microbacterium sp. RU33B]